MNIHPLSELCQGLAKEFGQRVSDQMKSLLEEKHLYQSIRLDYSDMLNFQVGYTIPPRDPTEGVREVQQEFTRVVSAEWHPNDPAHRGPLVAYTQNIPLAIYFDVPTIKLFCEKCNRIEAFNVVSADDFLEHGKRPDKPYQSKNETVQVFVVSLLCQSCKAVPDVFLIRRQGLKLTLAGRAPIEHVTVPPTIPKTVQQFYRGAIVAHQSGQTLAGNFLLRTLIEQWVREIITDLGLTPDKALDKYMDTIPPDIRGRFKSMAKVYRDLSADIHSATGSPQLFDSARRDIEEHYDLRRALNL